MEKQKDSSLSLKTIPFYSFEYFLDRLLTMLDFEESTLGLAMFYFDQFFARLYPTELNTHKALLISLLVAFKMNEDDGIPNSYFAEIAGISGSTVNKMESEFISALDYRLFLSDGDFADYDLRFEHEDHVQ